MIVQGIPVLVLLDENDEVITDDGRSVISKDLEGKVSTDSVSVWLHCIVLCFCCISCLHSTDYSMKQLSLMSNFCRCLLAPLVLVFSGLSDVHTFGRLAKYTLCSEKNTHSHFLSYLHELFVDLNKNCSEYSQGLPYSDNVKIRYSL